MALRCALEGPLLSPFFSDLPRLLTDVTLLSYGFIFINDLFKKKINFDLNVKVKKLNKMI